MNTEKISIIIASISLAYLILITSFYVSYYDQSFYEKHFQTSAYPNIGEEKTNTIFKDFKEYLDKDYFGYERTHLLSEFTASEQSHMKDVKRIIDWLCILYYISIILLIASLFFLKETNVTKVLRNAGCASLIVILLIGLSSIIDFTSAFSSFHKIFFPMGNWQFPMDSLLITMFPESFFKEFALRTSLIAIIISSACIASNYIKLPIKIFKLSI